MMSSFPLREYYCQSGYFLKIDPNGEVGGADRSGHKHAVFEVQTMRFGVVTLKAVHSGMFLSIDDNGKVHGKTQCDESCEFLEKLDPTGYSLVFQPCRFSAERWHLALGRQGQSRPAQKIRDDQKSAWFLARAIGGDHGNEDDGGIEISQEMLKELGFTAATGLQK
ncbi:fibroblast growth factor 2-like [Asterias rubens]|uniref:fibroblast growth factor 2-like n=1 Tax=Asterias rubens TaxID=7604 RepID=UPI001455A288|nr:fibroblast growth factor 2-like [Asterias rubens]